MGVTLRQLSGIVQNANLTQNRNYPETGSKQFGVISKLIGKSEKRLLIVKPHIYRLTYTSYEFQLSTNKKYKIYRNEINKVSI